MAKTSNLSVQILSGTIIMVIVFILLFANLHIPNTGEHTGYVSSVEESGIIWKTWTAYIKTDPQSSQEDVYCVTDPVVVSQLQAASSNRTLVTIDYAIPMVVWKWNCGDEQSIIQDMQTNTDQSASTSDSNLATSTTPVANPIDSGTTLSDDPIHYGVTITQTGGVGSQITSTTVDRWDMTASAQNCSGYMWQSGYCFSYLQPSEDYTSDRFYNAGDLSSFGGEPDWVGTNDSMTAYCKDGYTVSYASSPTNNPLDKYFMGVLKYGVGMEILDQPTNTIYIVCSKNVGSK